MRNNWRAVVFFSLVVLTIIVKYYFPSVISTFYFIIILIIYFRSKEEPFWLAFFLVISDGFLGFFGPGSCNLSILPGLPAIDVAMFYIMLSVIKARNQRRAYKVFYLRQINILGIYLVILLVLTFIIGVNGELNAFLRIPKMILPFLLFYSIPKLMHNSENYISFFRLIFPVAILASFTQIFFIIMHVELNFYLGAINVFKEEIEDVEVLRAFYNPSIILLTLFASLYFSSRNEKDFKPMYLSFLTISTISMVFLSATRGWILGFGLTLILYWIFVVRLNLGRILLFIIFGIVFFLILLRVTVIHNQINAASERFSTVVNIAEGDESDESQIRTTIRSPRVLKKWIESPMLGFGFSDEFRRYADGHVGNQNILLQSGILGFLLIISFFSQFLFKLFMKSQQTSDNSLKVFIVFFLGWFLIHSTSAQQFGFWTYPDLAFAQAVFFSFGAFCMDEFSQNAGDINNTK
jgi:hypothetical protein